MNPPPYIRHVPARRRKAPASPFRWTLACIVALIAVTIGTAALGLL